LRELGFDAGGDAVASAADLNLRSDERVVPTDSNYLHLDGVVGRGTKSGLSEASIVNGYIIHRSAGNTGGEVQGTREVRW
jgi:hypothetical protein